MDNFKASSKRYCAILESKKTAFYSDKIRNCGTNQKTLFAIVNDIRRIGKTQSLPEHSSSESLANDFARFFKEKIEKIVDTFPADSLPTEIMQDTHAESQLTNFKEVSTEDITRYINNEPNKYCSQVDPLPTELIKKNIDILGPIFTNIVNKSISSGSVPQAYKEAVVTPIIKKKTLEPKILDLCRTYHSSLKSWRK